MIDSKKALINLTILLVIGFLVFGALSAIGLFGMMFNDTGAKTITIKLLNILFSFGISAQIAIIVGLITAWTHKSPHDGLMALFKTFYILFIIIGLINLVIW